MTKYSESLCENISYLNSFVNPDIGPVAVLAKTTGSLSVNTYGMVWYTSHTKRLTTKALIFLYHPIHVYITRLMIDPCINY